MKKHAFILTTVLMTLCVCLPVSAKNKKDVLNRDNQQIEVVVEQNVELETEQKEAPKAEIKENCVVLEEEPSINKEEVKEPEAKESADTSIVNADNSKDKAEKADTEAKIDEKTEDSSIISSNQDKDTAVAEEAKAEEAGNNETVDSNKKVSLTPLAVVEEVSPVDITAAVPDNTDSEIAVGGTYTVEKGDCLWNIAKKLYGDPLRWTEIYQANQGQIANPNLIFVGQVLIIPN